MTILIVELDHTERQQLVRACTQAGCVAVAVWDGGAALDYLQMTVAPVWVILLDLRIALADATLCTTLRSSHVRGAVPIVIMSARRDTASAAARLGVGAYLTKPCASDTIAALVRCYAPLATAVGEPIGHPERIHEGAGDRR